MTQLVYNTINVSVEDFNFCFSLEGLSEPSYEALTQSLDALCIDYYEEHESGYVEFEFEDFDAMEDFCDHTEFSDLSDAFDEAKEDIG